jgi:hypothetical protein
VSVLSRVSAPAATHDLAGVVVALFSNLERAAPSDLPGSVGDQLPGDEKQLAASVAGRLLTGPTGLGTSAARIPWQCTAVGETVAATGRGTEPHLSDGPTGVGASVVRVSAERPAGGADASDEPVAAAYRSAFEHLAQYATPTQVARLRHELTVMFMAYNHEANWRAVGRIPPVWEYLTHRHENSFLPPMVLVDPIAGYALPSVEFADRRVRRVFCLADSASVILNDLYSMSKESDTDFDLPKIIAAEEKCSPQESIERTVQIHNELMHTFETEAAVLSHVGSLALRRFLTDIWAWLGGNREWHSTTERYHGASNA